MWLHGRPATTTDGYRRNAESFLKFVGKPLEKIVLEDIQGFATHLYKSGVKESSARTKLNAVKSLFTFATKLGYVRFNVAAALRIRSATSSPSGKILKQQEVLKLINCPALSLRDRCLLKFLYATGARVSEAVRLKWSDFTERDSGEVQVTLFGKGSKIRTVLIPLSVWYELSQLQASSVRESGVFLSINGKIIDRQSAHRIVKDAAIKAGVNPKVSPHWFRHNHITDALSKGAPIALVRDSAGHCNISVTNAYISSNPTDSSSNYLGL